MSDQSPVSLSAGLPETILPPAPAAATQRLADAQVVESQGRRDAVSEVVASYPSFIMGWAVLGDLGRDPVESYACYRVGYHRGLDALRRAGWKGSGYVRWAHEDNQGFLNCVEGLGRIAGSIGESDEAERCALFLHQLDPSRY
ncbi:MAG: DUF3151 domain-containing protein [Acidimicrobiales bacterium]